MSITPIGEPRQKITVASLREKKLQHQPITCLTAYDYATARLLDDAAIDIILVGDSLAQTMLGYENTLSVTVDEMLHHTRAVHRGVKHAFLIADMPYGSYHVGADEAVKNATRFMKEGGAEAVKMEGGEKRADLIRRIIDAEIPVAGHIGLTPQSVNVMSGYKVQGKSLSAIEQLMRDAVALDRAGVACIYLEGIPREVAAMITAEVATPTIGIGAGPECDGQVLVIPRHSESDVCSRGQVRAPLRRRSGADHRCGAGFSCRCDVAPVSLGQRVVSSAQGNAAGAGNGAGAQTRVAAIELAR